MAISLVNKQFSGRGLQVDRQASSNTRTVYVPPPGETHGDGYYSYQSLPFFGKTYLEWEFKKNKGKGKGKGLLLGPNSPFNSIPIIGSIL